VIVFSVIGPALLDRIGARGAAALAAVAGGHTLAALCAVALPFAWFGLVEKRNGFSDAPTLKQKRERCAGAALMTELQLPSSAITKPGWNFDQGALRLNFVIEGG
jgi:hypothetical protein